MILQKRLKTLDDLVAEAKAVIDARHYDDLPGQGKLFVEPKRSAASTATTNGHGGNGVSTEAAASAPAPKPARKPRKKPEHAAEPADE